MTADVLLIIDMQNGVCKNQTGNIENLSTCIISINKRIKHYREKKKPIIFIQHNDESLLTNSFSWEIIPELDHQQDDIYIAKTHANSFYKTKLQSKLSNLSVASIELCGAQTEYCMDSTIKVAHYLGYKLSLYTNLSTTFDNHYMSAKETIAFYESIWDNRFLTLLT